MLQKVDVVRQEIIREVEGVMNMNVNLKELETQFPKLKVQMETMKQNMIRSLRT